jgi:hypothetical protein
MGRRGMGSGGWGGGGLIGGRGGEGIGLVSYGGSRASLMSCEL